MYKTLARISVLLLPLVASAAQPPDAEPAEEYFHRGAQYYVWGEKERSKNEVFSGLRLYPADPLLNGLAGLLQKEEQQQQQQQNQEQQQQQSEQKKQDQQQQQSQEQSQQQPSAEQKPEGAKAQQEQQQGEQESESEPADPNQMTPEQARQLLDAEKGREKMLSPRQQKPANQNRKFKDW